MSRKKARIEFDLKTTVVKHENQGIISLSFFPLTNYLVCFFPRLRIGTLVLAVCMIIYGRKRHKKKEGFVGEVKKI